VRDFVGSTQEQSDQQRFTEKVEPCFDDLWRYCRNRSFSDSDADDALADVLAVAWRRRADLPEASEAKLWLYGVAQRVLSQQRRSFMRRQRLQRRLETTATADSYHHEQRSDHLWVALAELNEKDTELLLLRSWDEMPVVEMAALYKCSPTAMSLRIHRARKKLNRLLAKDLPTSGHVRIESTEKGSEL